MINDFEECRDTEDESTQVLDYIFSQPPYNYEITNATYEEQKRGIDKYYYIKGNDKIPVEYKSRTEKYTDMFFEIGSIGKNFLQRGWIYTCESMWIIYHFPAQDKAYKLSVLKLKSIIDEWIPKNRIYASPNQNYWTYGIAISPDKAEEIIIDTYTNISGIPKQLY